MFTCLKDYRTHPTSLEAALAIIIAVRSPRSLLVCCEATRRCVLLHCSEDVLTTFSLRTVPPLYSLTTLMQVTYCLESWHVGRKRHVLARFSRTGTFFTKWHDMARHGTTLLTCSSRNRAKSVKSSRQGPISRLKNYR